MKGLVSKKTAWCRVGGAVKHENLVANNLIKVKFPPQSDDETDISSDSPSSERMRKG